MELIERLDLAEWDRDNVSGGAVRLTFGGMRQLRREVGRAQAAETRLIGEREGLKIELTRLGREGK